MSKKTYYITTPLYYVNAKPHIGHAYTNVLCDCFARWHRFLGGRVFFLTGTDEHGTKIEKAARAVNKDPQQYADEMVPEFKDLWRLLGIRYDHFIRTTDKDHKEVVGLVLKNLEASGEVYKSSYRGWYCTPCESFWTELQLKDGTCPDCQREVQQLTEDNYFFRLAKYQDWLIETIQKNPDFIRPQTRRNEILGFLRQPLEDLCITRARLRLQWGIDYPNSKDHVVYVWFDALLNYVTAAGYLLDEKKFERLWPADLHMVGKDILRQHAIYWPIMLKAMGLALPHSVLAHGWWTMAGAKVSKSRGNAVDPVILSHKYGVDAVRYFLLREVTLGLDGAFSEDLLAERYTSDLANDLGNLWFRFAAMLEKYFGGEIPKVAIDVEQAKNVGARHASPLLISSYGLFGKVSKAMAAYDPRQALSELWAVIVQGNQFVEETKPWVLAKNPDKKQELAEALYVLGECLAHVSVLLLAFMPDTAKKILERLGLEAVTQIKKEEDFSKPFLKAGVIVEKGDILFPKLDVPPPISSPASGGG